MKRYGDFDFFEQEYITAEDRQKILKWIDAENKKEEERIKKASKKR